MITEYAISIDLGQTQDHIALSIIGYDPGRVDHRQRAVGDERYRIIWLEHYALGTPYRAVVEATKRHLEHPELEGRAQLIVDRGEVGKAVIEMFEEEGMSPRGIAITSGNEAKKVPGGWNVPKKDLVFALQVAAATGKVDLYHAQPGSPAAAIAEKFKMELSKFTMKLTKAGGQTFEALTERDHDDLVMSVAMGVWYLREYGQRYEQTLEKEQTDWDALRHGL